MQIIDNAAEGKGILNADTPNINKNTTLMQIIDTTLLKVGGLLSLIITGNPFNSSCGQI